METRLIGDKKCRLSKLRQVLRNYPQKKVIGCKQDIQIKIIPSASQGINRRISIGANLVEYLAEIQKNSVGENPLNLKF